MGNLISILDKCKYRIERPFIQCIFKSITLIPVWDTIIENAVYVHRFIQNFNTNKISTILVMEMEQGVLKLYTNVVGTKYSLGTVLAAPLCCKRRLLSSPKIASSTTRTQQVDHNSVPRLHFITATVIYGSKHLVPSPSLA